MQPKISVVIITYNHVNYIARTLDSVLEQKTNFDFEILIGEDESSDGTREICIQYANKFPDKIRLFCRSRKDVVYLDGYPTGRHNFNETTKQVKGQYMSICEGDDYWIDPSKLQKQVDFLETNPEYGIVAGDVILVNENNDIIPDNNMVLKQRANYKPTINIYDLLETNTINTLTVCVKSDLMKELVIRTENEDLWYVFDYWFWLNIGLKNKIKILKEKVAAYRVHSQGISHKSGFLSKRTPLVKYGIVMLLMKQQHCLSRNEKKKIANILFYLFVNKHLQKLKKIKLFKAIILSYPRILSYVLTLSFKKLFNF